MEKRDSLIIKGQLEAVSTKLISTKEKFAETVAELEALKIQAASNTRKLSTLRQQNGKLATERCALQKENDKLRHYTGKIEAKLALAAQQSGLANAIEKQSALEKQISARNDHIAELESVIESLKKEISITANALAMKEEDWGLRVKEAGRPEYHSCAEMLKTSLLRTVAALKHEADAFQLQLTEEERRTRTLQEELSAARAEIEMLTAQRADAQLAYDQLQVDYEHLMECVTAQDERRDKVDALQRIIKTQGRELKDFMALFSGRSAKDAAIELHILHAKLEETEKMINEAELRRIELSTQCEQLQNRVVTLEKVEAEANSQIAKLEGHIAQLTAELTNYKQLNRELYTKVERHAGYADANAKLLKKLEQYEVELARVIEQKADLQRVLINKARGRISTITTDS